MTKILFLFLLLVGFICSEEFKVQFQLKTGNITLNVNRKWAPNGVDRFIKLIKINYYENNGFFRFVPNFVVQFGINGNPKISQTWINRTITDDKVIKSNLR